MNEAPVSNQGARRSAVRRSSAERYLLITLVAFAATVILTRLFLELTGYPQLGNTDLHIAHVLWGGLLLFSASLLPLLLANRWALNLSALLSGIGVGLFIDEVGKFITQSNDYFYPPAAPIIYALFLLTALLYVHVRRPSEDRSPREALYQVLLELPEVLDQDLDSSERQSLLEKLNAVMRETDDPTQCRLAEDLLAFLHSEEVQVVAERATPWQNINLRLQTWAHRLGRRRQRNLLVVCLVIVGALALLTLLGLLLPRLLVTSAWLPGAELAAHQPTLWFGMRLLLQGVVGGMALIAAYALGRGQELLGLDLAIFTLTLSLTTLMLLAFYFDQFNTVIAALLQLGVLMAALAYRRSYLLERPISSYKEGSIFL